MIDISNTTSSAFREAPGSVTAGMVPTFSMAPLAGGIGFAKIEAKFIVDGKQYEVRDEDNVARQFRETGAKLVYVARCLGVMRQTEMLPCHCQQDGDSFDALVAAHPSLDDLKKRNEVHVFAAWSEQGWDANEHEKQTQRFQKFVAQIDKLENDGKMLDAAALRARLGWGLKPRAPELEIVGLFISQAMSGKWMHSHADRIAR